MHGMKEVEIEGAAKVTGSHPPLTPGPTHHDCALESIPLLHILLVQIAVREVTQLCALQVGLAQGHAGAVAWSGKLRLSFS